MFYTVAPPRQIVSAFIHTLTYTQYEISISVFHFWSIHFMRSWSCHCVKCMHSNVWTNDPFDHQSQVRTTSAYLQSRLSPLSRFIIIVMTIIIHASVDSSSECCSRRNSVHWIPLTTSVVVMVVHHKTTSLSSYQRWMTVFDDDSATDGHISLWTLVISHSLTVSDWLQAPQLHHLWGARACICICTVRNMWCCVTSSSAPSMRLC